MPIGVLVFEIACVERAKGRGLHDRECLRLFGFVPVELALDGFLNRNGLGLGVALVFNLVGHVVRDFRAFGAQRLRRQRTRNHAENRAVQRRFIGGEFHSVLPGGGVNPDAIGGAGGIEKSTVLRAGEGAVLQREVGVVKNESDESLGENRRLRSGAITRRGGVLLGFCDGGGALQAGLSRFHGEIADGLELALIVEQKILAGKIVDGLAGRIADNHAHLDQVDANLKSGRGLHLGNLGTGVCLGLGNRFLRRRRRWFFRRSRGSGILAARYWKK